MGTLATIKTKPNIYNSYFLCLTRWLIQINKNLHSQFRIALNIGSKDSVQIGLKMQDAWILEVQDMNKLFG